MTNDEAMLLAEWLGLEWNQLREVWTNPSNIGVCGIDGLGQWLHSPEGEVAMVDKLEELGWEIKSINLAPEHHSRTISVTIIHDECSLFSGAQIIHKINKTAPTRGEALVEAVLQMLEEKTK